MNYFKNKNILITGASSGIGECFAQTLNSYGAKLVLTARSSDKLEKMCSEMNDATFISGDLSDNNFPLELYKKYVQPTHEKIFSALIPTTPSILFTKESPHLDLMLKSGASVLSVGSCIDLGQAKKRAPEMIFQGNVDNKILADGTKEEITQAVRKCFEQSGRKNHILNLNHGLLERTPFENVQHFVDVAKELGRVE